MSRPVVWRPAARVDLLALYDWIAGAAGRERAFGYIGGIEAVTSGLSQFPDRGAPRIDLGVGIRTIVYRRRTVIAYRVVAEAVEIVHLAHRGRDLGRLFDEEEGL